MATNQPIIIKKIKKAAHAHHGGAWKVAYADFVTAMMAFFLLLWLLNVTTDIQRKGIADYFAPASISKSESGAAGIFGGRVLSAPEAKFSDTAPPGIENAEPLPPGYRDERNEDYDAETLGRRGDEGNGAERKKGDDRTRLTIDRHKRTRGDKDETGAGAGKTEAAKPDASNLAEYEKLRQVEEQKKFQAAVDALHNAIAETPELAALAKSLIVDQTSEGLRIQIVDQENYSMFPSGSAQMYPQTRKLLELVGAAISKLSNKLDVTGHTDSNPFSNPTARDNWDLSADRANASRRVLVSMGISEDRFQNVVGRADREPLVKEDPKDPKNRRISIVLLRQPTADDAAPQAPANEQ